MASPAGELHVNSSTESDLAGITNLTTSAPMFQESRSVQPNIALEDNEHERDVENGHVGRKQLRGGTRQGSESHAYNEPHDHKCDEVL